MQQNEVLLFRSHSFFPPFGFILIFLFYFSIILSFDSLPGYRTVLRILSTAP
jgi:hypothetical protein